MANDLVATSKRHWSVKYGGIPWIAYGDFDDVGTSCWGLVARVYREELGIYLPTFGPRVDIVEREYLRAILHNSFDPCTWKQIDAKDAQPFDLVIFNLRGCDSHVGIITEKREMLNVSEGQLSRVERYDVEPWITVGVKYYRCTVERDYTGKHFKQPKYLPKVIKTLDGIDLTWFTEETCFEPGTSILQALYIIFPNASDALLATVRVTFDFELVPPYMWATIKPRGSWNRIVIRIVPQASGIFKIILSLVVTVAAAAVSGGVLGPAGLGLAGSWLAAGSIGATLAGAAIGIGGALLVNALIPTQSASKGGIIDPAQAYTIGGYQNQLNADGTVPTVLGAIRFAPPYAVLPYSEVIGNDRYSVAMFLVGYGPVAMDLADIYIGNTPISEYQGVTVELREGYPDDDPITLYPRQVIEDADNMIEMKNTTGYQTRITAKNVTSGECEFYFAGGLIGYTTNKANQTVPNAMTVAISIRYRKLGTLTWTEVGNSITAINPNPFWASIPFDFPERGQYEVQSWRTTNDVDDLVSNLVAGSKIISKFSWSALRCFRPEAPLNYTNPMALIAVKIKASGQLSGQLQSLNIKGRRICLKWDSGTNTWILGETSNPADILRYVHQGPENAVPRTDEMIDLEDLQTWAEYCTLNDLKYDAVHQSNESQDDVLDAVASAGRALTHDRGDKQSIIVDKPRTVFNAFITPANSRDFTVTNPKFLKPDALEVQFLDATNRYQPASRIIPWIDHVGPILTSQTIKLPGKTDPDEIWRETRRKMYEADLRQNAYSVVQDTDCLCAVRGDAALVSHYVMKSTQYGGYVVIYMPESQIVRIDNLVTMEAGKSYQCRFRKPDNTTFVRTVITIEGETNIFQLTGSGTVPETDDLVMFGEVGLAEYELIVKDIEFGEEFSAQLNMVAHASTLDALAAAEVPPVWDGIIGGDGGASTAPEVPIIGNIISSTEISPDPPVKVFVPVTANPAGGTTAGFEVDHKLDGALSWTTASITVSEGGAMITGYAKGDIINIRVRAFGPGVSPTLSLYTPIETYTVGSGDVTEIQVIAFTAEERSGPIWHFTFALNSQPLGAGVKIKAKAGSWGSFADLDPLSAGVITATPYDNTNPVISIEDEFTFGCIAVYADGTESGTAIIIQVTTHNYTPSLDRSNAFNSQYQPMGWI